MTEVRGGPYVFRLVGDLAGFDADLAVSEPEPGLYLVRLSVSAPSPRVPPPMRIAWRHPALDIQACWTPTAGPRRGIAADWSAPSRFAANAGAPVMAFYDLAGRNRLTFACSDAMGPVFLKGGLREETSELDCAVGFFEQESPPLARYGATLRVDRREIPFTRSLRETADWWAGLPGMAPGPVPEAARLPAYSTWYSFHQALSAGAVEEECRLARSLGCASVIVDDGWQTSDERRGYASCGDWRAEPAKFPDMRAHVATVHAAGLKYVLWYALPFVGPHTRAWGRFQGKFLDPRRTDWRRLDPRFPEVREHLASLCERAVREWDLDGLKLDFLDSFSRGDPDPDAPGRDLIPVPEGVVRMLDDVTARLRRAKKDVLIEFRQAYTGPLMRRFGNMLRAGDCPQDAPMNRLRTVDVRLLAGETPVHADMLMWNPNEPVEAAALQFIHALFAVPQVSMRLGRLSPEHLQTVRFWLGFWTGRRATLLDGEIVPTHPELLYPAVEARGRDERILVDYGGTALLLGEDDGRRVWIVNGTRSAGVVVDAGAGWRARPGRVLDCRGRVVREGPVRIAPGVQRLDVPPAGILEIAP